MNNIDIKFIINDLYKYKSFRLINVYELDSKTIILKLTDKNEKVFIKLKSGYHLFAMDNKPEDCPLIPGSFCAKLRKHLNNKRLENIEQLGIDRIIDFQFGEGDHIFHIILELYSNGNIILTDKTYNILHLLRRYTDENQDLVLKVNSIYPVDKFKELRYNKITKSMFLDWVKNLKIDEDKKDSIKQVFIKNDSPFCDLGPTIISHCFLDIGINSNKKSKLLKEIDDTTFENLYDKIISFTEFIINCKESKGYILMHNNNYNDYVPYIFNQYKEKENIEFDCFNNCLKQYFNYFKEERKINKEDKKTKEKLGKVDRARFEIERRINNFKKLLENIDIKIEQINSNLNVIDKVTDNFKLYFLKKKDKKENIINNWYSNICKINNGFFGKDTESFAILYKYYFKNESLINTEDYIGNVYLSDINEKDELLEFTSDDIKFEINWNLSIHSNIRSFYDKQKLVKIKLNKTEKEGNKAVERIKERNIPESRPKIVFDIINKDYWFQKFHWFITSDRILFICGKNAEQNETIVKKYMNNNDIYIHGDFSGSPSGVLINTENIDVPLHSKIQAGQFLVCNTKNWKEKRTEKSYYVNKDQVSKSAPSGEYLTTGSFMVRGKKNYLPESVLEMGIGILFVLRDISDNIMNNFVVNPKENDDIIFCIPVCAPYRSLNDYKYKIKIKPGNQKKNKIIKSIIDYFCKIKSSNDKERYLMKNISNDYFHSILLNNSQACLTGFNKK